MHWSRMKSILIAVFIILDVYLLIQYFSVNESTNVISRTIIENTVSILENKDITISKDVIPRIIETDPETGIPYKTGADVLITFGDMAAKGGVTPCTIESLTLTDGVWTVTTDKGDFRFDATNLSIIN